MKRRPATPVLAGWLLGCLTGAAGAATESPGVAVRLVPVLQQTVLERLQERLRQAGGRLELRLERRGGRVCRLAHWRLHLQSPPQRLARWLEEVLEAGVVFGPPLEWSATGAGGLQAVAWSLEPGCPPRAEPEQALGRLYDWLNQRRDDARVLGPLLAALLDGETVALERLELRQRRLRLQGRAWSAAAATGLRQRLDERLARLSFPVRLDTGGLRAPRQGPPASPAATLALAETPAWVVLSAAAWLTGRAVLLPAAPGRLPAWVSAAAEDDWLEALAGRAGWSSVAWGKLLVLAPGLEVESGRPGAAGEPDQALELMVTGAPAEQVRAVLLEQAGAQLKLPRLPGRLTAYLPGVEAGKVRRALAALARLEAGVDDAAVRAWDAPLQWRQQPLHRLRLAATFAGRRVPAALFTDRQGGYLLARRGAVLGRRCARLLRVEAGRVDLRLECPGALDPARLTVWLAGSELDRSGGREDNAGP